VRVLAVLISERSFLNYMVPLCWALRAAGHDVQIAAQPALTEAITAAGLTAVPVGADRDFWRVTAREPDKRAAMRAGIAAPYDAFDDVGKATWEYLAPGMDEAVKGWHRLTNFPMIAPMVDYARYWQPDLVLWDPLGYAGAIAAKACGATHARLLFGIDVFGGVRQLFSRLKDEQPEDRRTDPLAGWLEGYARKYGGEYTEDMAVGHFTVDQLPPSLTQRSEGLRTVGMQFTPYAGRAVIPRWLRTPPERPRVALTLGLTATEVFNGYTVDVQ